MSETPTPPLDADRTAAGAPDPGTATPGLSAWMPIVVVPALIVLIMVLIALLFGGIAGSEATIEDNFQDMVDGGPNERTQAAFSLSQKIAANRRAGLEGEELPWPVPDDLLERMRAAWEASDDDDLNHRYVIASLLAQMGATEGVPHLISLLRPRRP